MLSCQEKAAQASVSEVWSMAEPQRTYPCMKPAIISSSKSQTLDCGSTSQSASKRLLKSFKNAGTKSPYPTAVTLGSPNRSPPRKSSSRLGPSNLTASYSLIQTDGCSSSKIRIAFGRYREDLGAWEPGGVQLLHTGGPAWKEVIS